MQKKTIRIKLSELCFYLFFVSLFWAKGAGMYDGQKFFTLLLLCSGFCWLGKMVFSRYSIKEWVMILTVVAIAAVVFWGTREKGIWFCVMLVLGMKGISLKKVMNAALAAYCLSFIPMAILTSSHLMYSPSKIHLRPLLGYVIRWGLGYVHPNVAHVSYLVFSMLVVYARKERLTWKECFWLMAGNGLVFAFTVSQTGFLMTTMFLAMVVYYLLRKKFGGLEYAIAGMTLPVCAFLSLVCPVLLKGKAFDLVNRLLNTRLYLSRLFLTEEQITLFGKTMEITSSNITMDNSYVFAFMTYGIVPFLLLMGGIMWTIVCFIRGKRDIELMMITGLLGAGLTEPFLFNTSFKNLLLLFVGACILAEKGSRQERQFGIPVSWDKEFSLPVFSLLTGKKLKRLKKEAGIRRKAILAGLAAGAVFSIVYAMKTQIPSGYIAPRVNCQVFEQESVYLTPEEVDSLGNNVVVMDYRGPDTEMIEFTGNLGKIEYIRGIATTFIYTTVLVFFLVILFWYMIKYNDLHLK